MIDFAKVPAPKPTPETQHFWDGASRGELLLQRCESCQHIYFPPRPFCPACGSTDVAIEKASGNATLLSYVINHRPHPAMDGPYSIAIIKLAEGPQMMTNIINVEQTPAALQLDMPLRVVFQAINDDVCLPYFEPGEAS